MRVLAHGGKNSLPVGIFTQRVSFDFGVSYNVQNIPLKYQEHFKLGIEEKCNSHRHICFLKFTLMRLTKKGNGSDGNNGRKREGE